MSETPNNTPATTEPKAAPPSPLASLSELNSLCRERQALEFTFKGRACRLEILPLSPAQTAKVREVMQSAQPKVIRGKTPEEDRLDSTSEEFVKRQADAAAKARALGLYWGVPALTDGRPGLTDPNQILAYVQDQLTDEILEGLWIAINKAGGLGEAELVNFT